MADIFISYSRKDRPWVKYLVDALSAEGYDVWWDLKIRSGESFDEAVERKLKQVRCIVAVWSTNALYSKWVRAEAAWAEERGTIVSICIDGDLDVPKLHRAHTESMVDWDGSRKSAAFRNLVENIRVVAGASKPAPEVFESPSKPVDEPQQRGISPPVRSRDSMSSFRDRLRDGGEGPAMVIIPAGSFWMGSFENLREIYEHRRAPHEVTFSRPFALGKRPVTFSEYDRFAKATGKLKPNDGGWGRGPRPVINVSWTDADVYADWLCEQSGRRFRLPSEAEWEYACRGGTQTQWFFGDEETDIGEYAWFAGNSGKRTHPAGQKKPNPWGLHDVHGNVLEWVQDCWHENYHRAPTDGSAWIQGGDCERRVVRGGSWYDVPAYLCSAKRDWNPRKFQSLYLGFRLALDLDK